MQCLILAGGLGTRAKVISEKLPKALLPIGPRAFIEWQLMWLKSKGVSHTVLALGSGGEEICRFLQSLDKRDDLPEIQFSFDGPTLLGTGGAIKKALPLLEEDFLVTYGDCFLFLDLQKMMKKHLEEKKGLTLSIFKNVNVGDTSNVVFESNRIMKYDKVNRTSEMKYIDYGMSVVNKTTFARFSTKEVFDFGEFLSKTCQEGGITAFEAVRIFEEVGSLDGYRRFSDLLSSFRYDLRQLERDLCFR